MATGSSSTVALPALLLLLLTALLLFADAKTQSESDDMIIAGPGRSLLDTLDCGGACKVRCGLSSRPRLCNRACGTCCQRCSCVPSGTYGNYQECPCYAKLTTHGGRRKCP